MTLISLGTIVSSVTLSAVGQICFKLGLNSLARSGVPAGTMHKIILALLTPGVMVGLGLYGLSTLLWLSALSRLELSQAYPFVGLGFAITTLMGWWFFSDHLTTERIAGVVVILVGIMLVART